MSVKNMMYDIILLYYVGYGLGKPQKAPTLELTVILKKIYIKQ